MAAFAICHAGAVPAVGVRFASRDQVADKLDSFIEACISIGSKGISLADFCRIWGNPQSALVNAAGEPASVPRPQPATMIHRPRKRTIGMVTHDELRWHLLHYAIPVHALRIEKECGHEQ